MTEKKVEPMLFDTERTKGYMVYEAIGSKKLLDCLSVVIKNLRKNTEGAKGLHLEEIKDPAIFIKRNSRAKIEQINTK